MIAPAESEKSPWKYAPGGGSWDEAVLPSGFPRRHWRKLFTEVGRMGVKQLSRRWQSSQQLIHSQGITYNVGNLPDGPDYAWPMDPIPLVIDEAEWAFIEQAVVQRASLLNAMLGDLYGEQRLLHERHVPAALAFANPNFLRPCFGFKPPDGVHLHTYAADIARAPDGRWCVVADRTQAPSGMGYTLQNRLVSARTLPGVFNQCRVRQLARFFDIKREALLTAAAARRSNPTVVLLSPGPRNETYFEHSFLAGHWGFTLVEGADLVVLDHRVYLKTLGGLQPVDLIIRRMDDSFCDPLELRGDSLLGIPGLLDAARAGSVVIDNALGSGLVETSAHMAFLPALSRALIGEELLIPSVATWWCGQEDARRYVRTHLADLVVKPAFSRFGGHSEFPAAMGEAAREDLIRRIDACPEDYVAQERVELSTVPVRTESGFIPRHLMLRVYGAWDGSGFKVMPGGLTRVSNEASSFVVSMQLGGGSKDTWVVGRDDEAAPSRRQPLPAPAIQTSKGDLPSRVADNLFWLGRYTERVDNIVRFVRALLPALSSEEDYGRGVSLESAARLLVEMGYLGREAVAASIGEQRWRVQRTLTEIVYDNSQTSSLRWNLREMRRTALHLKERISTDTWRVLQQLENQFTAFTPTGADQRYDAGMDLLDNVVLTLSAFSGLLMENTTRGFGWRFLEIGRRMERALQMLQLLQATLKAGSVEIEPYLYVLLRVADSSITYRTRYPTVLQTDFALEVLLIDESNPRAVAFQLATLLHQINRLQELNDGVEGAELPLALKAVGAIRNVRLPAFARRGLDGRFRALEELIATVEAMLHEMSDALTATYLSQLTASRITVSW